MLQIRLSRILFLNKSNKCSSFSFAFPIVLGKKERKKKRQSLEKKRNNEEKLKRIKEISKIQNAVKLQHVEKCN